MPQLVHYSMPLFIVKDRMTSFCYLSPHILNRKTWLPTTSTPALTEQPPCPFVLPSYLRRAKANEPDWGPAA